MALVSGVRNWPIMLGEQQGRTFLVYDNFRTLMRWNRAYHFAISVGMMAGWYCTIRVVPSRCLERHSFRITGLV